MTSRIARNPITIPAAVKVLFANNIITVKGKNGELEYLIPEGIEPVLQEDSLAFRVKSGAKQRATAPDLNALAGTSRALVNNMVHGVHLGYELRLNLVGVGYRAQLKGNQLVLALGFSHPVNFSIPANITIEVPAQTEIIVKGIDKQLVGETAAKIRAYRPPEPYKGKGIRYANEVVRKKEKKKK